MPLPNFSMLLAARMHNMFIHGKSDACIAFSAAVAFWYKPNSSHKHLYPAKKDAFGQPIKSTVNGEAVYTVCPYGIEVFRTKEGPQGVPGLAQFATDVNDSSKPRFDQKSARENVHKIIAALPERFTDAEKNEWDAFFDAYPDTIDDITNESIEYLKLDWLPPCTLRIPDNQAFRRNQAT
eukprot:6201075-Pleurochrysis_carterae.AAC.2